ncbi:MAG: cation transporter dimerization domain-containing protein, partial [Candidatus Freyarchaeota archaeon]
MRPSGPRYFVDISISVNQADSLKRAHDVSLEVERRVKRILPNSDIVVHTDPAEIEPESEAQKIRNIAMVNDFEVHDVHIHEVRQKKYVDLHLEVPPNLPLSETHRLADRLESEIRKRIPRVEEVNIHLKPAEEPPTTYRDITEKAKKIRGEVKETVEEIIGPGRCH